MCASHLSDPYMARSGRSSGNAAWLRAEMAQLEKRQSQFLMRGEHGEKNQIPQRYHDSKPNRDFPEQEMEEGRSRDGIASLMKAADRSRFRGEEWWGFRHITYKLLVFDFPFRLSSALFVHSNQTICSAYHHQEVRTLMDSQHKLAVPRPSKPLIKQLKMTIFDLKVVRNIRSCIGQLIDYTSGGFNAKYKNNDR